MKVLEPEAIAFAGVNPGEVLCKAREDNNWSQADVAGKLNLTVQALGHLESGAFSKLPGNTFARGYIRAYAKLLEIDQEPLVVAFDQLTGSNATGSNVHSLGHIEEPAHVAQKLLRIISFCVLIALALASYFWWQERSQRLPTMGSASSAVEHVEVEGADGSTQLHLLDEPEDQAVSDGQQSSELALVAISPDVAVSAPQPESPSVAIDVVATPIAGVTASAMDAPSASGAEPASLAGSSAQPLLASDTQLPTVATGEGLVSLKFTANCWTQLTDADGKVLFSALKGKGESLDLVGKAPLELRLGFARGVQVSYNGQVVDVTPYTSGETARMKLGL